MVPELTKVSLGGGCHWCTEAVFQSLKGVVHVDQGWIRSVEPDHLFSEAVVVSFDPAKISLDVLIEIHILTHSSTSMHKLRGKYRSAVYVLKKDQHEKAVQILNYLNDHSEENIITRVLRFEEFRRNKESYLNYYKTRPEAPFCKTFINPKLTKLMKTHGEFIKLT